MCPAENFESSNSSRTVLERCLQLSKITDEEQRLTRTYFTQAHSDCNNLVDEWMKQAGMQVQHDDMGNIIGSYSTHGKNENPPVLIIGSHLDTVVDAGKFDGILGVLVAIESISNLHQNKMRLPISIKVIGYANEEGVRFPCARTGSKAIAGVLNNRELTVSDKNNVTFQDAQYQFINRSSHPIVPVEVLNQNLVGCLEIHIEQGPVLSSSDIPVGIVTSIQGADRYTVKILGTAGHAGTVPVSSRKDAMRYASKLIDALYELSIKNDFMLTIGVVDIKPGATGTIPGEVVFTIDARSEDDIKRRKQINQCVSNFSECLSKHGLKMQFLNTYSSDTKKCSKELNSVLDEFIRECGITPFYLKSGAGHDVLSFYDIVPISMLFVSCKDGVSHIPEEYVFIQDVDLATKILTEVIIKMRSANEF